MGWWLFGSRRFLDADDEAWQLETWAWLLRQFGRHRGPREAALVTPTREFFPPTELQGHDRAEHVFACVKQHAGMADWPCELLAQPRRPERRIGVFWALQPAGKDMPLGTFAARGNLAVISYDPAMLDDPQNLIATLAHELAHYLLHSVAELPPGGEEMEEFATDLAAVYLGFGLFGAATAFRFRQFQDGMSQGWSTSGAGYLPQRQWVFGLAVFLALRGETDAAASTFLPSHLRTDLRAALKYLRRNPGLLAPVLKGML